MKPLLKLAAAGLTGLALFLLGKALLPLVAPFLLSLAAAAVLEPAVRALERRGVRRSLSAGLMTAIALLLSAGLLGCCAMGGAHLLSAYAKRAPALLTALTQTADRMKRQLAALLDSAPQGLEEELVSAARGISQQLSELPMWLSQKALDGVGSLAKLSTDWVLLICTAVIGIYFFSAYFPDLLRFLRRQLPRETQEKLQLIRSVTIGAVAGYLKVQCILSGVTFLILLAAFRWMGIADGTGTAAVIALVDALPVFGSGAVLLPWALLSLAAGNPVRSMELLAVYGVLLVSHNVLQAKLMGRQLGLHPLVALISLYVGWKIGGILGMMFLPLLCVLLRSLNEAGILHLYQ